MFLLLVVGIFDTGNLFSVRLGILRITVFSSAALFLWKGRNRETEVGIYPLLIGGFVLLSLGHAVSSVYFWVSLQHGLNIALAAVLLGWAYRTFRAEPDRAWSGMFLSVCGIAMVQLAVAMYERIVDGSLRPRGTFDNTNFFAEFMAVAGVLCLSRFLAKGERSGIRMTSAVGAVLFLGAALALSASRAMLIAVVPAVGILLLWRFGWRRGGVFLLAGGIPLLAVLGYQAVMRFTSPDPYNYSRLVMWKSAVRIFRSYPFGVGLGGYKYHWFATQSPIEGAFVKYGKYATAAHNEFLEVLTGLGAVGLVLFLLVLLVPVVLAVRGFRGVDEGRKWAAAGVAGGLLVSGIHAMFDFNFHEIGLVVLDAILLGALLAWLPPANSRYRFSISPWVKRFGMAAAILLVAVSTATVAGKTAHRMGVSRLQRGDIHGAERMFRMAIRMDPFCDIYPDAMAALGHRLYIEGIRGRNPDPQRSETLLTESIRWEAKAVSLSPRDFEKTSRLSRLFVDRYRVSRSREDLGAAIDWASRALEINPYSAIKLWDRAELLVLDGHPAHALADLARAVSIEPNFCRGYAKLGGLTKGKDEPQSRAWEGRAEKCMETARARTLQEDERWLVEEPETMSKAASGGGEDGEPGLPSGFSPSR
ncbi:MAG: O-antigen ligase family protein [Desulfobacteria bacterium]